MDIEKKKQFIINTLYITLIAAIIFLSLKFVLPMTMPFVIGFVIAMLLRPFIDKISKALKCGRKPIAIVVLALLYFILGSLIFIISIRLFASVKGAFIGLPQYYTSQIEPAVNALLTNLENTFNSLDPNLIQNLQSFSADFLKALSSAVTSVSTAAISGITSFISSVPSILIAFLFTIIASFFITMDYHDIIGFMKNQLPEKAVHMIGAVRRGLNNTIFKFLRAYLILMTITFIELSIGFSIMRMENAIGIAFVIALIDILPVLGTGGVVIPWFLIEFLNGNFATGIGLLIIYVIVTVIRNILEPKVVGDQIGLYPLITLFCMFVGAQLFGVVGLFGFPIAAAIIKNLNDQGIIHWIKPMKKTETKKSAAS